MDIWPSRLAGRCARDRNPLKRFGAIVMGGVLLLTSVAPAQAHPHIWINYDAAILFQGGNMTGLREQWVLDEDFSSIALGDLPSGNATKTLKPSDVTILEKSDFSNLKDYAYYQHIFIGGQDHAIYDGIVVPPAIKLACGG